MGVRRHRNSLLVAMRIEAPNDGVKILYDPSESIDAKVRGLARSDVKPECGSFTAM